MTGDKRPDFWLFVTGIWLCQVMLGLGSLWPNVYRLEVPLAERVALAFCCAWLAFAWLCGSYHLVIGAFSCRKPVDISRRNPATILPPIAVLYTTCNDFTESAFASCLEQDYPNYDVYILDDSNAPESIHVVDEIARRFDSRVTLIRRAEHVGFKAGNLNNGLNHLRRKYQFFAVCDADTILPRQFLQLTLESISCNDQIGFVQVSQKVDYSLGDSKFARELGPCIDLYWQLLRGVEGYGFVMFHGHGALVRMDSWRTTGGFPEVVAEDLAFSTRLRECGYFGVLENRLWCGEGFPTDYHRFYRRQLKYVMGTAEHARLYLWSFLKSSRVPWVEKVPRRRNLWVNASVSDASR